ncbi:MAG: DUF2510 domain-containing protein [Ilumatobacteraceae bacterium]
MEPTSAPAGWHPDPTGRYEFRYFNGQRWTSDVSVNGDRFIDHIGQPAPQPGWAPAQPTAHRPSNGFALAAFWVGLGSCVFSWVPFVFVLGAAGAITAIVFGSIALRRVSRQQGTGRGYAIAGLLLAVAALGIAVLGFILTQRVMREFDDFFDVGPHTERIDTCVATDGLVRVDGSITNEDTVTHSYTVLVGYHVDGDLVSTDRVLVSSVRPGDTGEFHVTEFLDAVPVECTIESVSGPTPFATGD